MFYLTFNEGLTLLGGFNQVSYLAWMRVTHERIMLELGEWPRAAQYAQILTDGLICGPVAFGQWASGLDLIWEQNQQHGKYLPGLHGGLSLGSLDAILATSMHQLIEQGVDLMLQVIE
jgi:hypothetical protein